MSSNIAIETKETGLVELVLSAQGQTILVVVNDFALQLIKKDRITVDRNSAFAFAMAVLKELGYDSTIRRILADMPT